MLHLRSLVSVYKLDHSEVSCPHEPLYNSEMGSKDKAYGGYRDFIDRLYLTKSQEKWKISSKKYEDVQFVPMH